MSKDPTEKVERKEKKSITRQDWTHSHSATTHVLFHCATPTTPLQLIVKSLYNWHFYPRINWAPKLMLSRPRSFKNQHSLATPCQIQPILSSDLFGYLWPIIFSLVTHHWEFLHALVIGLSLQNIFEFKLLCAEMSAFLLVEYYNMA